MINPIDSKHTDFTENDFIDLVPPIRTLLDVKLI